MLEMTFDGSDADRQHFLDCIREAVMLYTGELMKLDALLNEIAKNIFDHAGGRGYLQIDSVEEDSFYFLIRDEGTESFDFETCSTQGSRLAGNGINYGTGLSCIKDIAEGLNIDLIIDTTKGFSYSGVYHKA
jgi:anti-sigma regulatory factor (Ser/Thr protein kinase)